MRARGGAARGTWGRSPSRGRATTRGGLQKFRPGYPLYCHSDSNKPAGDCIFYPHAAASPAESEYVRAVHEALESFRVAARVPGRGEP